MPTAPTTAERTGGQPCGLREQKKRETRRALHRAALRLVHAEGLDAASTERIAAEAGVSPRTFFNYFPTKEAAVLGLSGDLPARLTAAFAARPPDENPWESVFAVSRGLGRGDGEGRVENRTLLHEVMRRHPELMRGLVDVSNVVRETAREAVTERLIAQGVDPDAARIRAVVYIDVGMMATSTATHLSRAEGMSMDEAYAEVERVLNSLGSSA